MELNSVTAQNSEKCVNYSLIEIRLIHLKVKVYLYPKIIFDI